MSLLRRFPTAVLCMLVLGHAARADSLARNGGFEAGGEGVPAEWNQPEAMLIPASDAFDVAIDAEAAHSGKFGAKIVARKSGVDTNRDYGRLRQSVTADAFRGRCARLTGWLRLNGVTAGSAGLFLRIDGDNPEQPLAFDNMTSWGLSGTTRWTKVEVTLPVPREAQRVVFGASLFGGGSVWVDDLELVAIECESPAGEAARPLEGRALDNLVAFARLLGYVRFFHPSDEAASANWDALAISGVRAVETADSPAALAAALQSHFAHVAPTARVVVTGQALELHPALAAQPAGQHRIIAWEHLGCGLISTVAQPSVYRSTRNDAGAGLLRRAIGGAAHSNMPKIDQPWTVDLPGGVTVAVPMALYADASGTLPHQAQADAPQSTDEEPSVLRRVSADDRAVRLAAVVLAWNVFQHFYPYFDVVPTDWHAELRSALSAAATDADEEAFSRTLRRLVARLHDGHGSVVSVSDRRRYVLPIAIDIVDEVVVVTAVHESVAPGVDLKVGDVLASLNGRPTSELLAELEGQISAATPGWMRTRQCTELLLGAPSSKARLEVRRDEQAPHETVLAYGGNFAHESRPEPIAQVQPGIWYVDIDRIHDGDFIAALDDLKTARGLVFDLRGYPRRLSPIVLSHLIDQKIDCARWNVPIVTRPDRTDLQWQFSNWPVLPSAPRLTKNVAFIIGGGAISYAETYMGMVEHYKLAAIVGEPTAGTNGNVNPFTVPGGYTIAWTGMKVLKHDGSQHHGVGIHPTVPVRRTIAGIRAGRDEFLERAIEAVSHAD